MLELKREATSVGNIPFYPHYHIHVQSTKMTPKEKFRHYCVHDYLEALKVASIGINNPNVMPPYKVTIQYIIRGTKKCEDM